MHGPLLAVAFASLLVLCTCGVVRDGKPPHYRGRHRHDSIIPVSNTSPPSDHSKTSSLRSWSFIEGLHTKNTCQDDTCSSSPYKLFPKSTTSNGSLTTTCFTVVALGCYSSKAPCCASLASSFQQMEFSIGRKAHAAITCVMGSSLLRLYQHGVMSVGHWACFLSPG